MLERDSSSVLEKDLLRVLEKNALIVEFSSFNFLFIQFSLFFKALWLNLSILTFSKAPVPGFKI